MGAARAREVPAVSADVFEAAFDVKSAVAELRRALGLSFERWPDLFTRLGFRPTAEEPNELRYVFDVSSDTFASAAEGSLGRHIRSEAAAPS